MNKTILITGITGFIGMHLARSLTQKGYEVYGVTKPSMSRDITAFKDFLRDVAVLTADVSDYQSIYNTLKAVDMDTVVHLAALSPLRDSFEKPFSYVQSNIVGTMNVAYSVLNLPDFENRKLIYASSAEVYGIQKVKPTKEEAALNPSSPYAVTKAATDMYLRMLTKVHGLNVTVMRCTNTFGRKLDTSFFVEYAVTNMLKGNRLYVGAPNSVRDYMYVDDHVNAYIKAIEHPKIKGEAFNFSTRIGRTNKEVAFQIADTIGYNKKNIVLGMYPPNYPMRPIKSDQPFILLDNTKARKMLGWEPKVGFKEGLARVVSYWKDKK